VFDDADYDGDDDGDDSDDDGDDDRLHLALMLRSL
jgi:hypothetical protein